MPESQDPPQPAAEEPAGQVWIFTATAEAEVTKAADAEPEGVD